MSVLPDVNVAGYVAGNQQVCHDQLVALLRSLAADDEASAETGRAMAFEIASKVGRHYCCHTEEPGPLGEMSRAKRVKAAADHPGLCGLYHAWIIAAVKSQDVLEKWGQTTGNKFRNQVRSCLLLLCCVEHVATG